MTNFIPTYNISIRTLWLEMNRIKIISLISLFLFFQINSENAESSVPKGIYYNPVLDYNAADPYVMFHNGFYYMVLSNNVELTVLKSPILTDWRAAETRVVYTVPSGLANLWAPEIHRIRNNWYIYFALDDGDNANHRMYNILGLNASDPLGPWTTEIRMRTPTEDFWAIDGTVLQYGNGRLYFIWSGWPTIDAGFPQNLYIAPMSDPMTISGPRVLIREPKSEWEMNGAPLLEGPQILQNNGRIFVVFSASGSWTADYCLGIMGIDDLKDPLVPSNWWNDVDRCIFWRNDEQSVFATGHASFTYSKDGAEPWIMYHATQAIDGGWTNRTSRTEKFTWNPDGSPSFPRPSGFGVPLDTPSGQD